MTPETQAYMKHLRDKAEAALVSIPKKDWGKQGAVNWGDIRVCDVRYYLDERGNDGYTITLEEAAPGSELAQTIWKAMGELPNVEVVCEW